MDFHTRITYQRTGIPRRFWLRETVPLPEVQGWIDTFPDHFYDMSSPTYGQGLVLCGTGASDNGAWLAKEMLVDLAGSVRFVDWMTFVDDLRSKDDRQAAMDEVLDHRFLVLDQVSMASQDWTLDVLSRVLKSRFDAGNPTVLTTSKGVNTARQLLANYIAFDPSCLKFVAILGEEG